jgi:hypothetical protein
MGIFDTEAKEGEVVHGSLDASVACERLSVYESQVKEMKRRADAFQVMDDEAEVTAVEMGNQAGKLLKAVEAQRKRIVEDPNQFVRSVNAFAKTFTEPLGSIRKDLSRKLSSYHTAKELERLKAERAAKDAAAKLQAKIDAEAKAAGVEAPKVADVALPVKPNVTRTAEGSAHVRKRWVGTVVDESLIPREYLIVDQRKINHAVASGVREIPGCKIEEVAGAVLRG